MSGWRTRHRTRSSVIETLHLPGRLAGGWHIRSDVPIPGSRMRRRMWFQTARCRRSSRKRPTGPVQVQFAVIPDAVEEALDAVRASLDALRLFQQSRVSSRTTASACPVTSTPRRSTTSRSGRRAHVSAATTSWTFAQKD